MVVPNRPALEGADIFARFSHIAVRPNVTLGQYASGRLSASQRLITFSRNGAVVSFRVSLLAPRGSRVRSRYVLEDARNGKVFSSAVGPAFASRPRHLDIE